jgi:hypothetical protein
VNLSSPYNFQVRIVRNVTAHSSYLFLKNPNMIKFETYALKLLHCKNITELRKGNVGTTYKHTHKRERTHSHTRTHTHTHTRARAERSTPRRIRFRGQEFAVINRGPKIGETD